MTSKAKGEVELSVMRPSSSNEQSSGEGPGSSDEISQAKVMAVNKLVWVDRCYAPQ